MDNIFLLAIETRHLHIDGLEGSGSASVEVGIFGYDIVEGNGEGWLYFAYTIDGAHH